MSEVTPIPANTIPPRTDIGLAWFVKQAILTVIILCLSIGGIAWLLHASIDPTLEAQAATTLATTPSTDVTGSIARQ